MAWNLSSCYLYTSNLSLLFQFQIIIRRCRLGFGKIWLKKCTVRFLRIAQQQEMSVIIIFQPGVLIRSSFYLNNMIRRRGKCSSEAEAEQRRTAQSRREKIRDAVCLSRVECWSAQGNCDSVIWSLLVRYGRLIEGEQPYIYWRSNEKTLNNGWLSVASRSSKSSNYLSRLIATEFGSNSIFP
jgi:hypothetical protein